MMDILISETCWAHKRWNKIATDIKFVFYSSKSQMYLDWIDVYVMQVKYYSLTVFNVASMKLLAYMGWAG